MKTERRHELQTNILANWLGQQIEVLRPYSNLITGTLVVVVLVAAVAFYIRSNQVSEADTGWGDYYVALAERDIPRLQSVAEDHPGTAPALWASKSEADLELARGIELLFTIRQEAQDALERAKDGYLEVEAGATSIPKLQYRAKYGLAQVHESLAGARSNRTPVDTPSEQKRLLGDVQGFLEDAARYYREVAEGSPESSLRKEANDRLEVLTRDLSAESWYTWFAQQTPVPPGAVAPGAGGFPGLPPNLGSLPDMPNFPVPGAAGTGSASGAGTFPLGDSESDTTTPPKDDSPSGEPEPESGDATSETPAKQESGEPVSGETPPPPAGGETPADTTEAPTAGKSDGS